MRLEIVIYVMMRYPLYNMTSDDFENLVVLICHYILGAAVSPFAKGKDGGKDGKFVGKANCFPSETNPWNGKIIMQAKHTSAANASCSDSAFRSIVKDNVIPSIIELKGRNEIDYYILFTNRKLTGIQECNLTNTISDKTGIPVQICAEEQIQKYLQVYPEVVRAAKLQQLLLPFDFDETDIKSVLLSLHTYVKNGQLSSLTFTSFEYPGIEKKNELNNMGKAYFNDIQCNSLDDFAKIRNFLEDPINEELLDYYNDAASELSAKIALYRGQFDELGEAIEQIHSKIVEHQQDCVSGKKRLLRTLLHYMYCNCDIGLKA